MVFDRERSLEGIISLTPRLLVGTTTTQLDDRYLPNSFETILRDCANFLGFKSAEAFLIRDLKGTLRPASRHREEELYDDFIASVGYQQSEVEFADKFYRRWRENKQNLDLETFDPSYFVLRTKKPIQLYWNLELIKHLESEGVIIPDYQDHRIKKYREYTSYLKGDEIPLPFEDWSRFVIFPLLTEVDGQVESVGYMNFEHAIGISGNEPIPEEKMEIAQLTVNSAMLPITVSVFAEELRKSRDRLIEVEKEALLKQVVFGAVHDINNMLTPISEYYSVLTRDLKVLEGYILTGQSDPTKIEGLQRRIERDLRSIQASEEQLKRARTWIASLGAIDEEQELESINLESLIRGSLTFNQSRLEGINVVTKYEDTPYEILGVGHKIGASVLPNLITNSLEAFASTHTENPSILLTTRLNRDNTANLIFEDNGPGVNPDFLSHMFDLYATTKSDKSGEKRGRGLHQVRKMMESIGGGISAESEQGKYTRFTLKFLAKKLI
jgi:signal transduction histidine kinase